MGWNRLWTFVEGFYPPGLANKISVESLLKLVVSGFSFKTIAKEKGIPLKTIRAYSEQYLEFYGWEKDLDFSPWRIYYTGDDYHFRKALTKLGKDDILIERALKACKNFDKILKEIDAYYAEH